MIRTKKEFRVQFKKSYHLLCEALNGEYGEEGKQAAEEFMADQQRAHRLVVGLSLVILLVNSAWLILGVMF